MRHVIAFGLIVAILGFGGKVSAAPDDESQFSAQTYLSTIIDNVPVPYDVLVDVQMKYQGHAVTKVRQITSPDGKQLYHLRVDNDDNLGDYDSSYLVYDMGWNLVDKKKMAAPPAIEKLESSEEKQELKKPEEEKPDLKYPEQRRTPRNITESEEQIEEQEERVEEDTGESNEPVN